MKLLTLILTCACVATVAAQTTYVPGYTKADGTYVQGHYKSSPNDTKLDNFGTKANTNPYTGKTGTVDPYKPQTLAPLPAPTYSAPKPQTSNCLRDLLTGKCM